MQSKIALDEEEAMAAAAVMAATAAAQASSAENRSTLVECCNPDILYCHWSTVKASPRADPATRQKTKVTGS